MKLAVVERAIHNNGRGAKPASKPTVSKLDMFLNRHSSYAKISFISLCVIVYPKILNETDQVLWILT